MARMMICQLILIFAIVIALNTKKECSDSKYYLDKTRLFNKQLANSPIACPLSYQIARILPNDKTTINHAGKFLFACLGPLKEAWILKPDISKYTKDKETNLGEGGFESQSEDLWVNEVLAKLIAPEAIEKRLIRFSVKNVQDKGKIEEIGDQEKVKIDIPVLCEKRQ